MRTLTADKLPIPITLSVLCHKGRIALYHLPVQVEKIVIRLST